MNSSTQKNKFIVVSVMYNVEKWIQQTIDSIKSQNHPNFRSILVDDISTDQTVEIAKKAINNDPRFELIVNKKKQYSTKNIITALEHENPNNEDIIVLLDGDDWFAHDNVLKKLDEVYNAKNCWLSYGNYLEYPSYKKSFIKPVKWLGKKLRNYRKKTWRFSHPKTFKYFLFKSIKIKDLTDKTGHIYKISGDMALMFPMAEMAGKHIEYIQDILYIYNVENALNDHKVKPTDQKLTEKEIRKKKKYPRVSRPQPEFKKETISIIKEAAKTWAETYQSTKVKVINPKFIYQLKLNDIQKIHGAWSTNENWKKDLTHPKYKKIIQKISNNPWLEKHPILIGISEKGSVTILDGNHRLLIAIKLNISSIPCKFYYFGIGDKVYPQHFQLFPERYTNEKIGTHCFPRNTCKTCNMCINTIEEYRDKQ